MLRMTAVENPYAGRRVKRQSSISRRTISGAPTIFVYAARVDASREISDARSERMSVTRDTQSGGRTPQTNRRRRSSSLAG